jgi:hypothetical protein
MPVCDSLESGIENNQTSWSGPEKEMGILAMEEAGAPFDWLAAPMQEFEAWMFEDWSTDFLLAEQ